MISLDSTIFVAADTETTGLRAEKGARLIEIAAVKIIGGKVQEKDYFNKLIDPQCSIPKFITKLTGITYDMVKGQPESGVVLAEFFAWVGAESVLIFQNAAFDLSFLDYYSAENRIPMLPNSYMDTMELFRALFEGRSGLDSILQELKITLPYDLRHRAIGDALATALAFIEMCQPGIRLAHRIAEKDLPHFLHRRFQGHCQPPPIEECGQD